MLGGDRAEIPQHAVVFAQQGVKISPRQGPHRDGVDGDRGRPVGRFSHEFGLAHDLTWTQETQHALLVGALADEDAHPT